MEWLHSNHQKALKTTDQDDFERLQESPGAKCKEMTGLLEVLAWPNNICWFNSNSFPCSNREPRGYWRDPVGDFPLCEELIYPLEPNLTLLSLLLCHRPFFLFIATRLRLHPSARHEGNSKRSGWVVCLTLGSQRQLETRRKGVWKRKASLLPPIMQSPEWVVELRGWGIRWGNGEAEMGLLGY